MRIIFEGLPGAGKTSISSKLSVELVYPLVEEFGGLSFEYWTSFELTTPFYRVNDELKEFIGTKFKKDVPVIFDRHYAGTLAYAYSLSAVKGIDCSDGECYEEEICWYQHCTQTGKLTTPDVTIILDITPELSLIRKPSARKNDPIWGDTTCLQAMRDYYHIFYRDIEPDTQAIWINAAASSEKVYMDVHRAILKWIRLFRVENGSY